MIIFFTRRFHLTLGNYMQYLKIWARDRYKPLAMMAQTLAVGADLFCQFLDIARKRGMEELTNSVTDQDRLHELYASPDLAFTSACTDLFLAESGEDDESEDLDLSSLMAPVIEVFSEIGINLIYIVSDILKCDTEISEYTQDDELYLQQLDQLGKILSKRDSSAAYEDRFLQKPEVVFTLRVLIPCWLEYGQTAQSLLDSATDGNLGAIRKLLQLDERFMEVPQIRQAYYTHRNQLPEKGREVLAMSFGKEPDHDLTPQRIRYMACALILHLSNEFWRAMNIFREGIENTDILKNAEPSEHTNIKKRLTRKWGAAKKAFTFTTGDLRELLNAVAKDKTNDFKAKDRVIAKKNHAFYTGILREHGFWQSIAPVSLK